jgi:multidrug resistance efflux pump
MKKKVILIVVLVLLVIGGGGAGAYYMQEKGKYVTTEDARVAGTIIRVSPQISGKLLSFSVEEGDLVQAGTVIANQETTNVPDNNVDMAAIKAPITGRVIKKSAEVGELVMPGQTIAQMVDFRSLYVEANIEEKEIAKLKVGQLVDIKIDAFPDAKLQGRVSEIGLATQSTFSLLPATNTSGDFTKVVQRIPIKIVMEDTDLAIVPGMNTVIKIHVK